MFDAGFVEVIVSLAFIYLLLSLLCSVAAELVAYLLHLRAANLYEGLATLLKDKDGKQWIHKVYRHPLINSLIKQKWGPNTFRGLASVISSLFWLLGVIAFGPWKPHHIPPRSFAKAFVDNVEEKLRANNGGSMRALPLAFQKDETWQIVSSLFELPFGDDAPPSAAAEPAGSAVPGEKNEAGEQPILTGRAAPAALPASAVQVSRRAAAVANRVEPESDEQRRLRWQDSSEQWFNESIPMLSKWYAVWMKVIITIIALIITVLLNADTIMMANTLLTWSADARPSNPSGSETAKEGAKKHHEVGDLFHWSGRPWPKGAWSWTWKIVGLLITATAVAQGSPFWFDLFRRVVESKSGVEMPSGGRSR